MQDKLRASPIAEVLNKTINRIKNLPDHQTRSAGMCARLAPPAHAPDLSHIQARLERRFGLGTNVPMRLQLYERLEASVAEYGQPAYRIIADVAATSVGKRKPDRYFCKSVVARLREHQVLATEIPQL